MTTELTTVRVECGGCGAVQELTAVWLPDGQEVNCSNCGSSLGTWRDLKKAGLVGMVVPFPPGR